MWRLTGLLLVLAEGWQVVPLAGWLACLSWLAWQPWCPVWWSCQLLYLRLSLVSTVAEPVRCCSVSAWKLYLAGQYSRRSGAVSWVGGQFWVCCWLLFWHLVRLQAELELDSWLEHPV